MRNVQRHRAETDRLAHTERMVLAGLTICAWLVLLAATGVAYLAVREFGTASHCQALEESAGSGEESIERADDYFHACNWHGIEGP